MEIVACTETAYLEHDCRPSLAHLLRAHRMRPIKRERGRRPYRSDAIFNR